MKSLAIKIFLFSAILTGCGDKADGECETDARQCTDENVLQVCSDGAWTDEEDCVASDMICHQMDDASQSHCMSGDM